MVAEGFNPRTHARCKVTVAERRISSSTAHANFSYWSVSRFPSPSLQTSQASQRHARRLPGVLTPGPRPRPKVASRSDDGSPLAALRVSTVAPRRRPLRLANPGVETPGYQRWSLRDHLCPSRGLGRTDAPTIVHFASYTSYKRQLSWFDSIASSTPAMTPPRTTNRTSVAARRPMVAGVSTPGPMPHPKPRRGATLDSLAPRLALAPRTSDDDSPASRRCLRRLVASHFEETL